MGTGCKEGFKGNFNLWSCEDLGGRGEYEKGGLVLQWVVSNSKC